MGSHGEFTGCSRFAGRDWIDETGADVEEIMDLGFDTVRIVAAVPSELDEKALRAKTVIVATEYEKIAKCWAVPL